MLFAEKLASIRILWRAPDTLDLWGIPYEMREGQTPLDLFRASKLPHPTRDFLTSIADWVWLGQPGWWRDVVGVEQTMIKTFLEKHAHVVPRNVLEYAVIDSAVAYRSPNQ